MLAELSRIMGIPNFIITEEPISIQLIYLNTFFWLERDLQVAMFDTTHERDMNTT